MTTDPHRGAYRAVIGHPAHRPDIDDCRDRAAHETRRLDAVQGLTVRPARTPIAVRPAVAGHDCPTQTCLCGLTLGAKP